MPLGAAIPAINTLAGIASPLTFPGAVNAIVPTGGLLGAGAFAPPPSALPASSPVFSNPVGLAALSFLGGFALGETVVRPLLGIEYPGGGGLLDYVRRHLDNNLGPTEVEPFVPPFEGGQSNNVVYEITADRFSSINGSVTADTTNTVTGVGPLSFVSINTPTFVSQQIRDKNNNIVLQAGQGGAEGDEIVATLTNIDVSRLDGNPDTGGNIQPAPGDIPGGLRSPTVLNAPSNIIDPDANSFTDAQSQAERQGRIRRVPELTPLSSPATFSPIPAPALPNRAPIPQPKPASVPEPLPGTIAPPEIDTGEITGQRSTLEGLAVDLFAGAIDPLQRQLIQGVISGVQDLFEPLPELEAPRLPPRVGSDPCDCIPALRDFRDEICEEIDNRLPDLPFDMAVATCSPDPLLGNGWNVSSQIVLDLQGAMQLLSTQVANLTSYTASCPLESQRPILVGVYYTLTSYPAYASFNFTNNGLYFFPRSGSVRFEGNGRRSEEYEVHGETGWVANPNPDEFDSAVWTGKDSSYVATLTQKLVSARLGRQVNLTFGA